MADNENIVNLDLEKLTTYERRMLIDRLQRYQEFFGKSIKQAESHKRTKEETYRTERRLQNYHKLLLKLFNKCGQKASTGTNIATLSGAAASNVQLDNVKLGKAFGVAAGLTPFSTIAGLSEFLSSVLSPDATDKEINEQLIAMLHTTVSMLEKCNITENDIRSALTNTIQVVTDIKNKYGDDLDDDELGKMVQEECSAWILENNITGPDFNKWKKTIEKNIGKTAWDKMADNSKVFIVNAEVLYEQMGENDDYDYSVICMAASKALEVEVARRYCGGYIRYLKDNNVSPIPSGVLDKYGNFVSEENFVFGMITDMTGYTVKNNEVRLLGKYKTESNVFLEYAMRKLFAVYEYDKCLEFIKKHIKMIDKVRLDYRNPAAHKSIMHSRTAKECLDYLVDIENTLGTMINDCNW